MIRIIKKIAHKFYSIGRFEDLRIRAIERNEFLNRIAEIDSSAWIANSAEIHNKSRSKQNLKIGPNSRIMGSLFLFDLEGSISIGADCFVGPDTRIWSAKKITIGNRVLIAHNVNIHDNISHPISAKKRYLENSEFVISGIHGNADIKGDDIIIGNDVWIGFNVTILRGVKIGDGAIIGAGSFVTKDVEPWTVNVGNPLRKIKELTREDF